MGGGGGGAGGRGEGGGKEHEIYVRNHANVTQRKYYFCFPFGCRRRACYTHVHPCGPLVVLRNFHFGISNLVFKLTMNVQEEPLYYLCLVRQCEVGVITALKI